MLEVVVAWPSSQELLVQPVQHYSLLQPQRYLCHQLLGWLDTVLGNSRNKFRGDAHIR